MNKQIVLAVVALLAVTVSVSAEPIFVENFSFELPGVGKPDIADIPGWTGEGPGGAGAETDWGPTDGIYTAFTGWDMEVYNLTDHTILANAEYTLTLDARKTWLGPDITIELYYDHAGARVPLGSLFHEFPGQDTTDMEELTLTVLSNDTPQSIGKRIGIQIISGNPGGDTGWIGYDNVRLDHVILVNAFSPSPTDGATDVCRDTMLMWLPGAFAVAHDVYLGTDFDDVKEATATVDPQGVYRGQVGVAQFDISSVLIPEYDQTYYWRIDEVDGPPANTLHKGDVWSFTVEPEVRLVDGSTITATASSTDAIGGGPETTVDGSGLDADDLHSTSEAAMWRSAADGDQPTWIEYDLGQVYSLAQASVWNYNGISLNTAFGMKEVTVEYSIDGDAWTELAGVGDLARASGTDGYAANSTIDFGGAKKAQYVKITAVSNYAGGLANQYGLSEIRFSYIPTGARAFSPADGATDVDPEGDLDWIPGRDATTHNVYFSADMTEVANRTALAASIPAGDTCQQGYDPGLLLLGRTYYWAVDEVSIGGTAMGQVLEFTVVGSLVIDDMEDYGDANVPGESGSRPWYVWKDGTGWDNPSTVPGNGTGSVIGNANPPFAEETIVYEGAQSLPYFYNNTGSKAVYSEATASIADLAIGSNWSGVGGKMIRVWFHGAAGNSAGANDQMYIKINGVKVVYDGPVTDLQNEFWQVWDIDLASFAGADLANVTEVSLVFGQDNGIVGGSGVVYFDSITLYPSICILSRRSVDFAEIDFVQDCMIDALELAVLCGNWLVEDSLATSAPPTTGLIGHWPLDGTVADASGSGNNLVQYGGVAYITGWTGQALDFDGVDGYAGIQADLLNNLAQFTLAGWVKGGNPRGSRIGLFGQNDCIEFGFDGGGVAVWAAWQWVGLEWPVDDDSWHHVAAVGDGTSLKLYFDGLEMATGGTTVSNYGRSTGQGFNIGGGGIWDTDGNWFSGAIDEVRAYSVALTPAQVAYLADDTPGDGRLHVPISDAELYDDEPQGSRKIDFKDYAVLMDHWLQTQLWP